MIRIVYRTNNIGCRMSRMSYRTSLYCIRLKNNMIWCWTKKQAAGGAG